MPAVRAALAVRLQKQLDLHHGRTFPDAPGLCAVAYATDFWPEPPRNVLPYMLATMVTFFLLLGFLVMPVMGLAFAIFSPQSIAPGLPGRFVAVFGPMVLLLAGCVGVVMGPAWRMRRQPVDAETWNTVNGWLDAHPEWVGTVARWREEGGALRGRDVRVLARAVRAWDRAAARAARPSRVGQLRTAGRSLMQGALRHTQRAFSVQDWWARRGQVRRARLRMQETALRQAADAAMAAEQQGPVAARRLARALDETLPAEPAQTRARPRL